MNKKKGFTLVELLGTMLILSLLMALAVPSIMTISNKIKERSLKTKIESIEESAVVYAQNNSNKIKSEIHSKYNATGCTKNSDFCECANGSLDCKYIFYMTVDELVEKGAFKTEKLEEDINLCDVEDPTDNEKCLDCVQVKILLDDDYKSADAYLNMEDIVDGKTYCK